MSEVVRQVRQTRLNIHTIGIPTRQSFDREAVTIIPRSE